MPKGFTKEEYQRFTNNDQVLELFEMILGWPRQIIADFLSNTMRVEGGICKYKPRRARALCRGMGLEPEYFRERMLRVLRALRNSK